MSVVNKKLKKGLTLIIRDDYFFSLIIKNYIVKTGEVKAFCNEHKILRVVLEGHVDSNIFYELKNIKSLLFLNLEKFNFENFSNAENLMKIDLDDSFCAKIDFGKFLKLSELEVHWNPNLIFKGANSLKWLRLYSFKDEITNLELPQNLECLEFVKGNIKDLRGLSSYSSIKMLSICYQRKLKNFEEIGKLKNLEYLNFTSCGKLEDLSFLSELKSLKYLILENCKGVKSIDSLSSIKGFKGVRVLGSTSPMEYKIKEYQNLFLFEFISYPYEFVDQKLYETID